VTTVLVTGATGFLGGRLVRALVDRGDAVIALVRTPSPALTELGVDQREVPLLDLEAVQRAAADADAIVHTAASADPATAEEVNVDATRAIAGAALISGQRLLHVSTTSVYDVAATGDGEVDEDAPRVARDGEAPPTSASGAAYATTKARGEIEVERAVDNGLVGAILRPPAILGAGPTSSWGTRVPERIRDGQDPPIAPDGNWGWVHVDDLVAALLAALDADTEVVRGLTVNVVAGHVLYGTYRDAVADIVGATAAPPVDAGPAWTGRYATRRLAQTLDVTLARTFDDAMAEIAAAWRRRGDT
jgi:nucleoside-diphosphate-sugar epimerase